MMDHGRAGELPSGDQTRPRDDRAGAERPRRPAALSLAEVLTLCDRHLQEVGRRNHRFGWLRSPDGGSDDAWLPVDAYYPRNRLVVLYRPRARAHDQLYRELVPGHGLRLFVLSPDELGTTPAGAERALAALLARLGPPAPPPAQAEAPAQEALWTKVSSRAAAALQSATARSGSGGTGTGPRPAARRDSAHGARAAAQPAAADGGRSAESPSVPPGAARAVPRAPAPPPSAAERAERFLTTRAARGTRRAPAPSSAESPLVGIAVGLTLFLVLLVAAIYIASSGG